MSFLPMYWQTCGYSDDQAGLLGNNDVIIMMLCPFSNQFVMNDNRCCPEFRNGFRWFVRRNDWGQLGRN